MYGPDNPKPITAARFESLCIEARTATDLRDECSLLSSLCRVMIDDLGAIDVECPPASKGTVGLMDVILCDFLIHRYEREHDFDPLPMIQRCLLSETADTKPAG
jgi:hypothetical protein